MNAFIGRRHELEEFHRLLRRKTASLVVIQGRRRIGKSRLVREAAKAAEKFLVFEGLPPRENIGRAEQLANFGQRLSEQTKAPRVALENWPQAFHLLASVLPSAGSMVLLLDEISWMATGDPDFPGHLKAAWDNHFSIRNGLTVVVCGSVSSWIQRNILNNTGFVGRCSWQFHLPPLGLADCAAFWKGRRVAAGEKLKTLAVTGGVPRYLEEIDPAQDAEWNIGQLCFRPDGLLFNEFEQIFHDIFTRKAETYRQIVATLTDGPRTVSEIGEALGHERGGSLSAAIGDLEDAGFIGKSVSFDPDSGKDLPRALRYRIIDNYLRFYLKYIEPSKEQIEKGLYRRVPLESLRAWDTIMGLQFENLILSNMNAVFSAVGLSRTPILNAGPYVQTQTRRRQGAQVDLLARSKHSLYVFEIKFRDKIGKSVIAEVGQKVERIAAPRGLSIRTGLIYQGALDLEVEHADFFDYLLPFEQLLETEPAAGFD